MTFSPRSSLRTSAACCSFSSLRSVFSVPLFSLIGSGCALFTALAPIAARAEEVIKVDGSSTVFPITEAVAEDFGTLSPSNAKVTVGVSGTGGGFKKFCAGETDISDASRPIKAAEIAACKEHNIEYIELPVAYDALTVVINPKNSFAKALTVAELKKIWEPEAQGKITKWNQIRPEWPDEAIKLFGPGVDNGTYDYFTEAVVGKEHSSRGDYTSSADPNVLVQGVAGDKNALGFFGFAYYHSNIDKLQSVAIDDQKDDNGKGPIPPSPEAVINGTYRPLSRPLFIYVRKDALERESVKKFVTFYLEKAPSLSEEVGYVKAPEEINTLAKARFTATKTGTVFAAGEQNLAKPLAELMKQGG